MKTKKWALPRGRTVQSVSQFISRYLKLGANEQLVSMQFVLLLLHFLVPWYVEKPKIWNMPLVVEIISSFFPQVHLCQPVVCPFTGHRCRSPFWCEYTHFLNLLLRYSNAYFKRDWKKRNKKKLIMNSILFPFLCIYFFVFVCIFYVLKNEFGSCFLEGKTNYMKILTSNPTTILLFISNSINHRCFIFWSIYYTKAKDRIKHKTNLKTESRTHTSM